MSTQASDDELEDEEFDNDEFIADWNRFLHKEGLL